MADVLLQQDKNGVRTLTFNRPHKLNGWSKVLVDALRVGLDRAAKDETVNAVVITGSGKYYSAGVDFSEGIELQTPKSLVETVRQRNEALFGMFIYFPKILVCACNGPSIGAAVTSALICDAIVASETCTFLTPFQKLGIVPEGCSTVTYPLRFGEEKAKRLLEGEVLDAQEALRIGFADFVVPKEEVLAKAQEVAEEWVHSGRKKRMDEENLQEKMIEANANESVALSNALIDYPFIDAMIDMFSRKQKWLPLLVFIIVKYTRPIWSRL